jgi:hypothetical protein
VQTVFSKLQSLASVLPGGPSAGLHVAASDGKLTVKETFALGDLPLGFGQLTNISLDLGLAVTLAPMSVDFLAGLGAPGNPFDWVATPLSGNGLMCFGVQDSEPAFVVQAGIGLGCSIDLGIASGSASVTVTVTVDASTTVIKILATLTAQASVDILGGLASLALSLAAALGFQYGTAGGPAQITSGTQQAGGADTLTLLASCSVGIHISICWLVSVSWDGSWQFSQVVSN